jgi:NAD(P)-dependent dehydrogenase (short-subunit alcohol dehydrogenase family)
MRILITGCSTGFGRASAVELTKRGHDVVATARKPDTLDELDVADRIRLDVDDDASVSEAMAAAGEIDALVNNAGFGVVGPIERVPVDEIRRMLETNLLGAVRMIQAVLPAMRARGSGTIVNVTSVAGRVTGPLGGTYAATKHALEAISESLHYEVGHFGIRIRVVEPGYFETDFQGKEPRFGVDDAPYDELDREWTVAFAKLRGDGNAPGAEPVAAVIADAVESTDRRLRWPVGADAEMILSTRASTDDEGFEDTMRGVLDLTW